MKKLLSIALLALPLVACGTTTSAPSAPATGTPGDGTTDQPAAPTPTTITAADGGTVEADGIVLTIPAGALDQDTDILITKTDDAPPARHAAVTPLYTFQPDGLKLKKPATVTFKNVPTDAFSPVIGWAKGTGFVGLDTKANTDGTVTASVSTLASTFVAKTECMKSDGNAVADLCHPVPAPATVKSGRYISNFAVTGFEYWQWKKPDPYDGGNAVAWGYNGDGEPKTGVMPTDVSRACMAEAFRTLVAILADPPQELKDLRAAHGVEQFWFWNNDMTDAKSTVKVPKGDSELWLYDGSRGDGGLIKWISETERDGTCKLPTREDLVTFAKACKTDFPNCGSGK